MSTAEILQMIHDTWLGQVTREHAPIFTTALVIHFVGICLMLGAMLVIDLRLLGVGKQVPIKAVLSVLPVAIFAFVINLLTGIVFFCFDPVGYYNNPAFKMKVVLILIAGLNALFFTLVEHKKLVATGPGYDATALAKISAALSLFCWFAVILFGRLIVAFQGATSFFS